MTDFFDLSDDAFVKSSASTGGDRKIDTNIYNPDPNGFNGSYKSVFRFLPYVHDKTLSKYTKYSAKFYNALTKETLYVDCPSNVGKPSILWDLDGVIRSLKDDEPDLHNQLSNAFSRWHSHYSPIYVKKDPQRPELEGEVKLFKFANQVNNLIEEQIKPEENELLGNVQSVNPYHLLQGKDFLCVVGKKTKQFRDWTKCKFMDDITPFIFKIGDKNVAVENNEKSVKLVQEFLKKNTPSLDEYMHREWDDETREKVASAIISAIGNRAVIDILLSKTKDAETKAIIEQKLNGSSSTTSSPKKSKASESHADVSFESSNYTSNFDEAGEDEESDEYSALFNDL
jgi:hypothetical protein